MQNRGSSAEDLQLGQALRAARSDLGLTIAAVARNASISPSALSQIEAGTVNPSLSTLRRLAIALGKPVAGLLAADGNDHDRVVRAGQRTIIQLPGSPVVYELLSPDLNGQLEILHYELKSGERTLEATHPGEETLIVLEGAVEVEADGRNYSLKRGDTVTYPSSVPHAVRNVHADPAKIICAFTPPNL